MSGIGVEKDKYRGVLVMSCRARGIGVNGTLIGAELGLGTAGEAREKGMAGGSESCSRLRLGLLHALH